VKIAVVALPQLSGATRGRPKVQVHSLIRDQNRYNLVNHAAITTGEVQGRAGSNKIIGYISPCFQIYRIPIGHATKFAHYRFLFPLPVEGLGMVPILLPAAEDLVLKGRLIAPGLTGKSAPCAGGKPLLGLRWDKTLALGCAILLIDPPYVYQAGFHNVPGVELGCMPLEQPPTSAIRSYVDSASLVVRSPESDICTAHLNSLVLLTNRD